MPVDRAVEMINWFPQPGYVELRRGYINYSDTGSAATVDTLMAYQGLSSLSNALFAVTDGDVFDVTTGTAVLSSVTGLTNSRIQKTMFNNGTVAVLWCCNGDDTPFYYNGTVWTTTAITGSGFNPDDIINVVSYRNRLWCTVKNTTKAVYLGLNSITGAGAVFDVGAQFPRGGSLMAIGTWSTDTTDGPNEFIAFFSSYGDLAVYQISDPTDAVNGIAYLGTSQIGSPIGRRCFCRVGADLVAITIDGVIPISQVLSYDRAAISAKALTANIRTAMTQAAKLHKENFGWQFIAYARNTMAILNVPLSEGGSQEQYVMNTLTGAWCRFVGQYANCWEVFEDRAYFGDNDGLVMLADEASGDEDNVLSASVRGAFNPYTSSGNIKQWQMVLPLVTINTAFPVNPELGINVDFQTDGEMSPIDFTEASIVSLWNSAIWNTSLWPGDVTASQWASVNGIGRYASIRMTVDVPWDGTTLLAPLALQLNSFTVSFETGGLL